MKGLKFGLLLVLLLALVATACSSETTDTTAEGPGYTLMTPGTLTVCTDSPYSPMEFEEDGAFTGFDIDLIRAVATEMGGLSVEVINSGFDPITSGTAMQSGQCDMAVASITITDEREANIDFSNPYFIADQSLLVKKDSGIATIGDLAGQRVGVQSGTTGEMYANTNAPGDAEIVAFDNPGDLFVALEANDIVGILQDLVVNGGRLTEDTTVSVVETYPTNELYGFAFKNQGDEMLAAAVNEALSAVRRAGTYDQIWSNWFGK